MANSEACRATPLAARFALGVVVFAMGLWLIAMGGFVGTLGFVVSADGFVVCVLRCCFVAVVHLFGMDYDLLALIGHFVAGLLGGRDHGVRLAGEVGRG